jgi:hypothetical protein
VENIALTGQLRRNNLVERDSNHLRKSNMDVRSEITTKILHLSTEGHLKVFSEVMALREAIIQDCIAQNEHFFWIWKYGFLFP